jgi:hypothetical protein
VLSSGELSRRAKIALGALKVQRAQRGSREVERGLGVAASA